MIARKAQCEKHPLIFMFSVEPEMFQQCEQ